MEYSNSYSSIPNTLLGSKSDSCRCTSAATMLYKKGEILVVENLTDLLIKICEFTPMGVTLLGAKNEKLMP